MSASRDGNRKRKSQSPRKRLTSEECSSAAVALAIMRFMRLRRL